MSVVRRSIKGVTLPIALLILLLVAVLTVPTNASAVGGAEGPSSDYNDGDTGGTAYGQKKKSRKKSKSKRSSQKQRSSAKKKKKKTKKPSSPPSNESKNGPVFPVKGDYTFGEEGARFGAPRSRGKKSYDHQGQDIIAAQGTPVVAPTKGTVRIYKYQAGGAGYYLVINDAAANRDYVFMHLKKGSVEVDEGDTVSAGQKIAEVGSTGSSSGPHLHFEIWEGGWYIAGGKPIDPLSELKAWAK